MSTLIQPDTIDRVRRQFLKANIRFDSYAAVFQTVAGRLEERLELLAINPERVLDLGCRTGYQLAGLQQRYPDAMVIGADPAPGMPQKLQGFWSRWLTKGAGSASTLACDPHELPFPDASFDLVVSNLLLPWCHSPHRVFEEVSRILSTGGVFMFTTAGPDTLTEYRDIWRTIDTYQHDFGLIDMHDLGDTLMASGFAAPVLDRGNLVVDYPNIESLQLELRQLGAANLANGRRKSLTSPTVCQRLIELGSSAMRFPVTLELVQGHGWKGDLQKASPADNSELTVSVDTLRGSWRRRQAGKQ